MKLTSPSQVKRWCLENNFHPQRSLGQNFLIDSNILEHILAAAQPLDSERVLEIGPGLGILTEALLEHGALVTAVEKDRRLAERLHQLAEDADNPAIIAADALQLDLDTFLTSPPFALCVSNLPYSVGTRILMEFALHPAAPQRFVVMVQQEVAERFRAGPGSRLRGQASVWLQLDYEVRVLRVVKPSCFWPRPEVHSAIVGLWQRRSALTAHQRATFLELTRQCFTHRRKQLFTLLRKTPSPFQINEEELRQLFTNTGVDPRVRPENLANQEWQTLALAFSAYLKHQQKKTS